MGQPAMLGSLFLHLGTKLLLHGSIALTAAHQLKQHRSLPNEHTITEHQNVHFGPQEAVKCFRWFADDGFILVERGIENYWHAR